MRRHFATIAGSAKWFLAFALCLLFCGCSCTPEEPVRAAARDADSLERSQDPAGPEQRPPNVEQDAAGSTVEGSKARDAGNKPPDAQSSHPTNSPKHPPAANAASAEDALRQAEQQYRRAQQQAERGEPAEAFGEALQAWESLAPYRAHPGCRELADEILASLEIYGETANRSAAGAVRLDDKRLTIE